MTPGEFIRFWFACIPSGFIEMTYIHPVTGEIQSNFIPVSSLPSVPNEPTRALEWNKRGFGIYFGTTPSDVRPAYGYRRREYQVSQLPGLWMDMDTSKLGISLVYATALLLKAQHQPSAVISSGGGLHVYWRFAQPYTVTSENRDTVKRTLEAIATCYKGGDKACRDMARVLRLPGTVNTKPERANVPCKLLWCEPDNLTTYEDMQKEYAPFEPQKELRTVRSIPVVDQKDNLPEWINNYINHGGSLNGSRNRRLYTVARKLNDLGYSQTEAENLTLPAYLKDNKGSERGREKEGLKTIASAYRNARSAVISPRMNLRMAWGDKAHG
jgi:hypothetical protein